MNLSRPVLGALTAFIFLFTSNYSFAQVTAFVPESEAISILNDEKSEAESDLSDLVQATPVLQGDDLQGYADALAEAQQEYSEAKEALEFKIAVSEKMLFEISQLPPSADAVKTAVVNLLERIENSSIGVNSYAFADQVLIKGAGFNSYILGLLGE